MIRGLLIAAGIWAVILIELALALVLAVLLPLLLAGLFL